MASGEAEIAAYRQMTASEYRETLARLGYTQEGFARLVGASPRTGQKWALGEARVPGPVAVLLALVDRRPELRSVLDDIGAPPVRARALKKP